MFLPPFPHNHHHLPPQTRRLLMFLPCSDTTTTTCPIDKEIARFYPIPTQPPPPAPTDKEAAHISTTFPHKHHHLPPETRRLLIFLPHSHTTTTTCPHRQGDCSCFYPIPIQPPTLVLTDKEAAHVSTPFSHNHHLHPQTRRLLLFLPCSHTITTTCTH